MFVLKVVKKVEVFCLENEISKLYIGLVGNLDYC